jgi:acyl-coenzyme A synthetase/AMP-(fatty) acid ligase
MLALSHWLVQPPPDSTPIAWRAGEPLTAGRLLAEVRAWRARYAAEAADQYLLWCGDSYRFLVQLLALWAAGKIVVVPANGQSDTVQALLPEVAALVSDDATLLSIVTAAIDARDTPAVREPAACAPLDRCREALVLYTSGSTGTPKRVSRTLAHLEAELDALHRQFADGTAGTVLATVPHHHVYGLLFRLLWPLCEGWPFVVETMEYPEPMLAALRRHAPARLIASPAHLARLGPEFDWPLFRQCVHRCFSSGAPLPLAAARAIHDHTGQAPIEVLGSTETGGVAFRQRQGAAPASRAEPDWPWQTLPGVQFRIDADGALQVASKASTLPAFGPIGDRAERCGPQTFHLRGREDRIVKVEGKRLSLSELEQALIAGAEIANAAATVCYHNRDLVAVVVVLSAEGEQLLARLGQRSFCAELRQRLADRFDRVLLPRWFRFVSELPVDARGKTTQQALQQLFSKAPAA